MNNEERKRSFSGVVSFRTRLIGVFAFSITVLILVFSGIVYFQLNRLILDEFDKMLHAAAARGFTGPPGRFISLRHFEHLLTSNSGIARAGTEYIFLARRDDTGRLFVSRNWPEELHPSSFTEKVPTDQEWKQALKSRKRPGVHEGWPGRMDSPQDRDDQNSSSFGSFRRGFRQGRGLFLEEDGLSSIDFGLSFRGYPERGPDRRTENHILIQEKKTVSAGGEEWWILEARSAGDTLFVGLGTKPLETRRKALIQIFIPAYLTALLLALATSVWLVSRALRPIRVITREAEAISTKGLKKRIAGRAYDKEFAHLINTFNEMLSRLEEGFGRSERFGATVAHQLRTPLTVLSSQIEREMLREDPSSDRLTVLAGLLDETDKLRRTTDQLLLLSRAESGSLVLLRENFSLSRETERLIEDLEAVSSGLRIRKDISPDVYARVDPVLFSNAVFNLLVNAEKHNDERREVSVRLDQRNGFIRLEVFNTGPVITPEEANRIFQYFYQQDQAHREQKEGLGLGLPIAREIVHAHGGELELVSSDSRGTTFAIELPIEN